MKQNKSIFVCGLPYAPVTPEVAATVAKEKIKEGGFYAVFTPGATIHAHALRHREAMGLLSEAHLLLPDGQGILLAARLSGSSLPARCAGIDFAECLLSIADGGTRFFFYGGKEGVARRAAEEKHKQYPHLAFAHASGYGEDPVRRIGEFAPHALFVCLGYPKQEAWILSHREELNCLCVGLGGTFDVWSGGVKRAPSFFRRMGLEWAYRTLRDPGRIGKLFPLPAYFWSAWQEGRKKARNDKQNRTDFG